jgi:hypothetical protein
MATRSAMRQSTTNRCDGRLPRETSPHGFPGINRTAEACASRFTRYEHGPASPRQAESDGHTRRIVLGPDAADAATGSSTDARPSDRSGSATAPRRTVLLFIGRPPRRALSTISPRASSTMSPSFSRRTFRIR